MGGRARWLPPGARHIQSVSEAEATTVRRARESCAEALKSARWMRQRRCHTAEADKTRLPASELTPPKRHATGAAGDPGDHRPATAPAQQREGSKQRACRAGGTVGRDARAPFPAMRRCLCKAAV